MFSWRNRGWPDGPDKTSRVEEARSTLGQVFGLSLATKATDRFLEAHSDVDSVGSFLEAMSVSPLPVVLELDPGEQEPEALDRLPSRPEWRNLLEGIRSVDPGLRIHGSSLLRRENVKLSRDSFLRGAGPLIDALDHDGERRAHRLHSSTGSDFIRPLSEACWLNGTIRSRADTRVLADIAAADMVVSIDLPRRIALEIDKSTVVVGAPRFRSETGTTGRGVTLAIIDTEVAQNHPALENRVVHMRDYTSETWGSPGSHATFVAGIAAGNGDFEGVAPEAEIYNYKIVSSEGWADDFYGGLALQHSLEDGADIANCSWGQGPTSQQPTRLVRACNRAWSIGMVIVKSAGNDGPGRGTMTSPGEADGIITVGATTRDGTVIADYSSRGPIYPGGRQGPHLVAPGGSTDDPIRSTAPGGGFDLVVPPGTSYAAPHVSGLAALLLQKNPDMSPDDVRDRLVEASSPINGAGDEAAGAGLVSL